MSGKHRELPSGEGELSIDNGELLPDESVLLSDEGGLLVDQDDHVSLFQDVSKALLSDASNNVFAIGGRIDLTDATSSNRDPIAIRWDSGEGQGRKVSCQLATMQSQRLLSNSWWKIVNQPHLVKEGKTFWTKVIEKQARWTSPISAPISAWRSMESLTQSFKLCFKERPVVESATVSERNCTN